MNMRVIECSTGKIHDVRIEALQDHDYRSIRKSRFYFDWKTEKKNEVFKIVLEQTSEILGLISLIEHADSRIEINLLAASKENRGKNKCYDGIITNLIAWTCREAIARFDEDSCVSLVPKTSLVKHYIQKYNMQWAGKSLVLIDDSLVKMSKKYMP